MEFMTYETAFTRASWAYDPFAEPVVEDSDSDLPRQDEQDIVFGKETLGSIGASKPYHKMPTFISWREMITRVRNPNRRSARSYVLADSPVGVMRRWLSFQNFWDDMGDRPFGHTLDRIDNLGHYETANCRWATFTQQVRNRSVSKLTFESAVDILNKRIAGIGAKEIAREYGISISCVYSIGKDCWFDAYHSVCGERKLKTKLARLPNGRLSWEIV